MENCIHSPFAYLDLSVYDFVDNNSYYERDTNDLALGPMASVPNPMAFYQ